MQAVNVINTFEAGMDKDLSKTILPKNKYTHAENLRLITDKGQGNGTIVNFKGTDFSVSIPDTLQVNKITIGTITGGTDNLTIDGQTGLGLTLTSSTTPTDIYNYIYTDAAYTRRGVTYNVYIGTTYVLIVGINTNISIITSGDFVLDPTYIPAQTGLEIIGQGIIRDDMYLFTTNNTSKNPGGHDSTLSTDTTSVGQIWKMTYDKLTFATTLTLIYNNYVDFTTYHPIPHNAVEGRYENILTQRLFWTDNFNVLRQLNVTDPNAFAVDVSILAIKPQVTESIPILQKIQIGGSIPVGVYQASYRLKNNGGAVTQFSPVSNLVSIVTPDESINTGGANFKDYNGSPQGTISSKSITWKINNLDTDFDRIEVVVLKRESRGQVPDIEVILDEPIPDDGELTFTYTGNELDPIPVTLNEFTALSTAFTHCKTIATKDNRLFAGNVRNSKFDIDYDARAFRAKTSGGNDVYLTNSGTQTNYTLAQAEALAETVDAINDYTNANAGFYRPGTTTLGGTGTNISYEFGTIAVRGDSTTELISGSQQSSPYRHTNPMYTASSINLGVSGQDYPTNQINDGLKYPYLSGLLKGYQREEIYRFAFVAYDKTGNPSFAKWIGDIKMPAQSDLCPAGNRFFEDGTAQTTVTNFVNSFMIGDECWLNLLYVKFNVSIPASLTSQIGGYSIVRVERTKENRTIAGQGIVVQAYLNGVNLWVPAQTTALGTVTTPFMNLVAGSGGAVAGDMRNQNPLFLCPDFLLDTNPSYAPTDQLKLVQYVQNANTNTDVDPTGGATDLYRISKLYSSSNVAGGTVGNPYTINSIASVDTGGQAPTNTGGFVFFNFDRNGGAGNQSRMLGNKVSLLETNAVIDYATNGFTTLNSRKYIANYVKTLSAQYGGNTYSQRSNNEYIFCGHYQPVANSNSALSHTVKLFGGDVFVTIFDSQRGIKNWGQTGRGVDSNKNSMTFFFPCETVDNTDLRYGDTVNQTLDVDNGTKASAEDDNITNTVYGAENNIIKFYPKPAVFLAIDEFDNRIHASELKINGENINSWGIFKPNNYWDVEGSYGPINALEILQDQMYCLQDKAFSRIAVNPRVLIQDESGAELQLGTGNIIQRHDYISTEAGCKHQWAITKSPYSLFFFDITTKKFYRFSSGESLNPLSDIKGMQGWFSNNLLGTVITTDNPIYRDATKGNTSAGIHMVYNFRYNEAIVQIRDYYNSNQRLYTLSFNEQNNAFVSFHDFYPKIFLTDNKEIFSTDQFNPNDIYIHEKGDYGNYYGTTYFSRLEYLMNDNPINTKVLDNLVLTSESIDYSGVNPININDDTWSLIRVYNDYQNTDFQSLTVDTNIKRRERSWQIKIPRNRVLYTTSNSPDIFVDLNSGDKTYGERLRDKYYNINLIYYNTSNYNLITHNIATKYRVSDR